MDNRQDREDAYIEIIDWKIFQLISDRSLLNRQQNEDTIIRVLDKYIFQSNSDRSMYKSPSFMSVPSKLTGKDFETAQEWFDWWTQNKDKLVLSEDGTMLVTK